MSTNASDSPITIVMVRVGQSGTEPLVGTAVVTSGGQLQLSVHYDRNSKWKPAKENSDTVEAGWQVSLTEMQKLAGIVVSPQKTLDDINQRPTWLLPFVLLLVFNLGVNFVVYRILITDTNFEQIARVKIQWDASAAGKHLSDASVDQQINSLRRGRKYWYALPLIGVPVSMLSLSIVFYFALLLVRAGTTFRKVFAVICWSFIVYRCVGGLSTIVALLARGTSKFFPGAPESWSPTSLAQFVSRTSVSPNVYSAISKLDIFLVWWLGILVIGLWKISSRLSLTKTATLVISLEVGYLLANGAGWFAGTL